MLNSMADAVLVVDSRGHTVLTNPAYQRLFGSEIREPRAMAADGRELPAEDGLRQRASRGDAFTMEFTARAADGSQRWFEASSCPITGPDDHESIVVIRDVTDRSLRRLQDQFLAMASHELRTPLTALSGYAQLLERALAAPAAAAETSLITHAHTVLTQARRLQVLMDDLLDTSRLEYGRITLHRERLDLAEHLRHCEKLARTLANGQQIALQLPLRKVCVDGDPGRLEQVFLNLLTNAITYAPNSERIDVRLAVCEREAQVQVQDYGSGIKAADLPNLFTRFYQAGQGKEHSGGGLGLGLFIANELVKAHDGRLEVFSKEGEGSTFTVTLPLAET